MPPFASSTAASTAAWSAARPRTGARTARGEAPRAPAGRASATRAPRGASTSASVVPRRCTAPYARRCAWARSRPSSPWRSRGRRKRAVGPGPVLEGAAQHLERGAARRASRARRAHASGEARRRVPAEVVGDAPSRACPAGAPRVIRSAPASQPRTSASPSAAELRRRPAVRRPALPRAMTPRRSPPSSSRWVPTCGLSARTMRSSSAAGRVAGRAAARPGRSSRRRSSPTSSCSVKLELARRSQLERPHRQLAAERPRGAPTSEP